MSRRYGFVALAVVLLAGRLLAESSTDLTDYVTVEKAVTAQIQRTAVAGPIQPGHLGVSAATDGSRLKVTEIEPRSAAERTGLKVGDQLVSIDGDKLADPESLRRSLYGKQPGQAVAVVVRREGKSITYQLTLAAPSNPLRDPSVRPVMGVQLEETERGVRIDGVTPGSPADVAGLKTGDVVQKLNGVAYRSLSAFRNRLAEHSPGENVTLALVRAEKPLEVALTLAATKGPPAEGMPTLARWNEREQKLFRKPVYKLAVIPIAFSDQKLNDRLTPAVWETALFSTAQYKDRSPTGQQVYGSMNDYYQELSAGKFKVEGKVFTGITVEKKRTDYTQIANRWELQTDALNALLKRDGEAALDNFDGIFFIYAGARLQTQRGGIFWPHRSGFRYKGKGWDYFICPEGGERMANISVISHEFGHMLGLPDLYDKPENPGSEGLGVWCTMSVGHGQDGKPLHFSAWCKEQLGWIKPTLIDPRIKQKLILGPAEGSERECYKVLLRPDGGEYLLLENRQKKGFDKDLPGEGLLIWRVVDNIPVLEESHGIAGPDGPRNFLGSVPFPSLSNTAFTPDTIPSSRPSKSGGWNVHITNIRKLPDGRITFQIGYEYL